MCGIKWIFLFQLCNKFGTPFVLQVNDPSIFYEMVVSMKTTIEFFPITLNLKRDETI